MRRGHAFTLFNVPDVESQARSAGILFAPCLISHGGLNSTLEALSFGIPLIVLPFFGDQHGVAARVAYHGVGEWLAPKKATLGNLGPLVRHVVTDPSYRQNASRMAAAIRGSGGIGEACDLINQAMLRNRGGLDSSLEGY